MLTDLVIRDVVLVDRLEITASHGLIVMTGETGAGKSILLDALGLAVGARADTALIRRGQSQASVSAVFDIDQEHPVWAILDRQDIAPGDGIILRRVVGADGRSRGYVNDQPVSVALLREVGELLVEIQGQHDQSGLLNPATHRGMLDAYASVPDVLAATEVAYEAWCDAEAAAKEARLQADDAARDVGLLRHAREELDSLSPREGEDAELAQRRALLQIGEQLTEAIGAAHGDLAGADGAEARIRRVQAALGRLAERVPDLLDDAMGALDRANVEIGEAVAALAKLAGEVEFAPGELDRIEQRLFTLRDLARKHGVRPDQLEQVAREVERKLSLIENRTDRLETLNAEAEFARDAYVSAAADLTRARKDAAQRLDRDVAAELAPLKLERACFQTRIVPLQEAQWGPYGTDQVRFEIATIPENPPGPLHRVASGGELSRIQLALRLCLAQTGVAPTLIFDEVDAGVGGATATAVGRRLQQLSQHVQVLVVTHSPQVAACGSDHLRVEKREERGRLAAHIARLKGASRREEVARMLAGATVTDEARAAAEKLIKDRAA